MEENKKQTEKYNPDMEHVQEEDRSSDELDQLFQKEFANFEATPSEEVWGNISTRIPLSLKVKRQLTWWSKIAAALILGLSVTVGLKEYQKSKAHDIANKTLINEVAPVIPIESDFVFDLRNQSNGHSKKASKEKSARELLNEDYSENIADRTDDIIPLEPIESKVEKVVGLTENPLNDKQKSSPRLGDMPLRTQNATETEMLSLTPDKVLEKGGEEDNQ